MNNMGQDDQNINFNQQNQSNWNGQSSWNYGYNNAQNPNNMNDTNGFGNNQGTWNGYTWQPQNGYNGQPYNGQQQASEQQVPGQYEQNYQYNKPVETLDSIKNKFNSTAKWLKAMGMLSQFLMLCSYSIWLNMEKYSQTWTESYIDDYGISGMAKLGSIFVGIFGLILFIAEFTVEIPLFVCQMQYNKPGQRPNETILKVVQIVALIDCCIFWALGYWAAIPTLIVTLILQFKATRLRTTMEAMYVQQTGQNINRQTVQQPGYEQSQVYQNGYNINNNQNQYSEQNKQSNNVQYNTNNSDVFVTDEEDTQEQNKEEQVSKDNNTQIEKAIINQENSNTEANKEQKQENQEQTIEENEINQKENQDQEKPEIKTTENGGENIG